MVTRTSRCMPAPQRVKDHTFREDKSAEIKDSALLFSFTIATDARITCFLEQKPVAARMYCNPVLNNGINHNSLTDCLLIPVLVELLLQNRRNNYTISTILNELTILHMMRERVQHVVSIASKMIFHHLEGHANHRQHKREYRLHLSSL